MARKKETKTAEKAVKPEAKSGLVTLVAVKNIPARTSGSRRVYIGQTFEATEATAGVLKRRKLAKDAA